MAMSYIHIFETFLIHLGGELNLKECGGNLVAAMYWSHKRAQIPRKNLDLQSSGENFGYQHTLRSQSNNKGYIISMCKIL